MAKDQVKEGLDLLGLKVKDKVTEVTGIADSVCFDLYGCVQVSIRPKADEKGKLSDAHWFDIGRITVTGKKPVMDVPTFGLKKGPAEKPAPR